jgi:hypothetical protein
MEGCYGPITRQLLWTSSLGFLQTSYWSSPFSTRVVESYRVLGTQVSSILKRAAISDAEPPLLALICNRAMAMRPDKPRVTVGSAKYAVKSSRSL